MGINLDVAAWQWKWYERPAPEPCSAIISAVTLGNPVNISKSDFSSVHETGILTSKNCNED